ncbi:uncharacterized protein LOC144713142 [Wolffia australiana]
MDVPPFEGSWDPKDYEDWERELKSYFKWYDMDDDLCVTFAKTRLGKEAKIFWLNEVEAATRRLEPPMTWADMMRRLRDKYVLTHHMTHILLRWLDLKQGRRKAREYIIEFEQCRMRCTTVDRPEQEIAYFVHGLRPELGAKVLEQNPATVDLACKIVEDSEYIMENASSATTVTTRAATSTTPTTRAATSIGWTRTLPSVAKTSSPTTMTSDSTAPPCSSVDSTARAPVPKANGLQCFKCKGFGHRKVDCPSLNFVDFKGNPLDPPPEEDPEVDIYLGECADDEEECAITARVIMVAPAPHPMESHPSYRPLINVGLRPTDQTPRESGLTTVAQPPDTIPGCQRSSIFYIYLKIGDRTCKLIVDSGSCINAVSEDAAAKLGLALVPHPVPYHVSWVDASTLPVKHQYAIPLRMSTYEDTVICDVLPMRTGSIILGRPWLFDHNVRLDGRANTISFIFRGRQLLWYPSVQGLTPVAPPTPRSDKPEVPTDHKKKHPLDSKYPIVTNGCIFRRGLEEQLDDLPVCYALAYDVPSDAPLPPSDALELAELMTEYHEVFPDELPDTLPPMRSVQHAIDLVLGAALPNLPHYRIDPVKYEELYRKVKELLSKGLIREILSPCAVPTLLASKKDGTWCMCCDSRAINKITVKYCFPIPRVQDLFDQMAGVTIFSKVDLRSGYHQVRIRPGDEWKTAFKIQDGLFEWNVMPFGLSNAPGTFQQLMNEVLRLFIGRSVVVYFDDILVYSRSRSDHLQHLREVWSALHREKFYAHPKKCSFFVAERFEWTNAAEKAFEECKQFMTVTPMLQLSNFKRVFEVACDASAMGVGGVLSQEGHPVEFFSEKLDDMKRRYENYDREFYAILKEAYVDYLDFEKIFLAVGSGPSKEYSGNYMSEGYLFCGKRLCVPRTSARDFLIWEAHAGGLNGHPGVNKTILALEYQFYWPSLKKDVGNIVSRCLTCSRAKMTKQNAGLYRPLLVPTHPWDNKTLWILMGTKLQFSSAYHPQKDGQTEVVNRSLGNLLRSLVGDNLATWDRVLPRAEFAYNSSILRRPLDLAPVDPHTRSSEESISFARYMKDMHHDIHSRIIFQNEKYKTAADVGRRPVSFSKGDLVMVRLRSERYSPGVATKLHACSAGPFPIARVINENAYVVGIPSDKGISSTFNGQPSSEDAWISEEDLRRLRPGLIQPLGAIFGSNSPQPSSSHPGRMMEDHPQAEAQDRPVATREQPRREARVDAKDASFKYTA